MNDEEREQQAVKAFKQVFQNPGAYTDYIMTLPFRRVVPKPKESTEVEQ